MPQVIDFSPRIDTGMSRQQAMQGGFGQIAQGLSNLGQAMSRKEALALQKQKEDEAKRMGQFSTALELTKATGQQVNPEDIAAIQSGKGMEQPAMGIGPTQEGLQQGLFAAVAKKAQDQAKAQAASQERAGRLQEAQIKKLQKETGGPGQSNAALKLEKMGAEAKNKIGGIASGFKALDAMQKALDAGFKPEYVDVETPVVGRFMSDTPFTRARRTISEVVGRLQSGGAINKEEGQRFMDMGPRPGDTPKEAQRKVQDQISFLKNKLAAYGIKHNELSGLGFDVVSEPQSVADNQANQDQGMNQYMAQIPGMEQQIPYAPNTPSVIPTAQAGFEDIGHPQRVEARRARLQELMNKAGMK